MGHQQIYTAHSQRGQATLPDGFASSSDLEEWPVAALDGDPDTRWTPSSGVSDPVLSIDLGSEQEVTTVRLDRAVGRVTVATDSERHVLPGGTTLTIPEQRTRHLTLTFSRPPGLAAWSAPEVSLPGADGPHGQPVARGVAERAGRLLRVPRPRDAGRGRPARPAPVGPGACAHVNVLPSPR